MLDTHLETHRNRSRGGLKASESDFRAGFAPLAPKEVESTGLPGRASDARATKADSDVSDLQLNDSGLAAPQPTQAGSASPGIEDIEHWLGALPDEYDP